MNRNEVGPVGLALILLACIVPAATAQEYSFKLHHFLSAKAPAQSAMLEPWAKQVEANSGGRVRIEIFPSMSLGGKPPELIRQVRDGVVDLVWTVNGYTPGLFPRTEVFELPTVYEDDPRAANLAMQGMFEEHLAADYAGVKVMFLHVHAGQALHTVDALVRTPAQAQGLQLRIPTRTGAWVIEALGASPVAMPVPDLPQALSKKVVDGALIPFEIIPALKLQDQTQYQIEGADGWRFGTTTFQVSMNLDRWNGLPADVRQAFLDASGPEWWAQVGEIWARNDDDAIQVAVAAGNEHVVLTEAETAAFRRAVEPVTQRWIDEMQGAGIDGQALVDRARELVAEHGG